MSSWNPGSVCPLGEVTGSQPQSLPGKGKDGHWQKSSDLARWGKKKSPGARELPDLLRKKTLLIIVLWVLALI